MPNPNIPVPPPPFRHRLTNLARALAGDGLVKIAAIGSSTTAGEGGIPPYPERLERALRARPLYKDRPIVVLNRGKGGDEAPGELTRLQTDVIDQKPALVIWQVGTNAVWNGDDLDATAEAIRAGLELLHDRGMDIVLMDLQYVPAVLTPDRIGAAKTMVALIAAAAETAKAPVNVFQRFAYMQAWHRIEKISFDRVLDPTDLARLHHSDWSIQRITDALCQVMLEAIAPEA
jgi:hypothetical protein